MHVARLYRPTIEGVKNEVIRLARSAPPFSYEDLYELVWDNVRCGIPESQIVASINGLGQRVKRESYARAFPVACSFFRGFPATFIEKIEPRTYSIGRNMRVPFAPSMICGTRDGLVIPWLLFWKTNPMTEEQTRLFISMALGVIENDGELDQAALQLVDTSEKALSKEGMPSVISSRDVVPFTAEKMRKMLETFAAGFALAQIEWSAMAAHRSRDTRTVGDDASQADLFEI